MTTIQNEAELEERLSRPTDADAAALSSLEGDLLILGAGGKMGPSLAKLARRAADKAGVKKRVIAVARYSNARLPSEFASCGIEAIRQTCWNLANLRSCPNIPNVIYMAAKKFGTSGAEHETWAMNTFLPGLVANRFRDSRIVAFSTGNVYPLRAASEGGADEFTPVAPVGEYAQSALGRERMFEYASAKWGTPVAILRLNYAIDLAIRCSSGHWAGSLRAPPGGSAHASGKCNLARRCELMVLAVVCALPVTSFCAEHHGAGDVVCSGDRIRIRKAFRSRTAVQF